MASTLSNREGWGEHLQSRPPDRAGDVALPRPGHTAGIIAIAPSGSAAGVARYERTAGDAAGFLVFVDASSRRVGLGTLLPLSCNDYSTLWILRASDPRRCSACGKRS